MIVIATDKGNTVDLSLDRVSAAILLEIMERYNPNDWSDTPEARAEIVAVRDAVHVALDKTSGV